MANENPMRPNSFLTPNVYVDTLMSYLTSDEYKLLSYAARRIFGFRKHTDKISLTQFTSGLVSKTTGEQLDEGTGLNLHTVKKAIAGLKQFGILIEVTPAVPRTMTPAEYELQEDINLVDLEGLKARKEQLKQAHSRKAPIPISRGDTGGISRDAIGPYHAVIDPPITRRYRAISRGDTTKERGNKEEIKIDTFGRSSLQLQKEISEGIKTYVRESGDTGQLNSKTVEELVTDYTLDWFLSAFKLCVGRNKGARNLNYVRGILEKCKLEGHPPDKPKEGTYPTPAPATIVTDEHFKIVESYKQRKAGVTL